MEDLSNVCRGCLTSSSVMKNMRDWGLVDDYHKITNILIDSSEGISELICVNCEDNLTNVMKFIDQCRQSNVFLKNEIQNKNLVTSPTYKTKSEVNTIFSELHDNKLIIMITAPNSLLKIHLNCPYCDKNDFIKKTDLSTHIIRYHECSKDFDVELQYYCPIIDCKYHRESNKSKFFHGRKFLNQHMNKVHNESSHCCTNCKITFSRESDFVRHLKTCNHVFMCQICNTQYKSNELLLVHLLRKHPDIHKQYKAKCNIERKEQKSEHTKRYKMERSEYLCYSPKRSFATQTLEENIRNDVRLPPWQGDKNDIKRDEISTQTFDMLGTQTNEDESIFSSETVSLSDIQTQTTPVEFGLCRSNKQTVTSETQSPDLSMKETQTCFCLYDSQKPRYLESVSCPNSMFTSTETQTLDSIL